jgi:hypothetical protein
LSIDSAGRDIPSWGNITNYGTPLVPHNGVYCNPKDLTTAERGDLPDMKRKITGGMVQSAIRLPRNLYERLREAGGERGMGEEIRRRLEASFGTETGATNQRTAYLLNAISSCAEKIDHDYGNWSEDAFAFEVLKGCVNMLWTHFQPKGEPVPKARRGSFIATLFGPETSPKPEELSRLYVHSWISSGASREKEEHQ